MGNNLLSFVNELLGKFLNGLPGPGSVLILLVIFTAWAFLCSGISAFLKTKRALRTGYTRKTFHFLVFISAAVINLISGFSGVCLFGIVVSCFILYALIRREASGLYGALAREKDHPHGALYIFIPFLSTLAGGILINYFFPGLVILGYLVCGIADASGEVIGTMYGRHTFKVRWVNIHNAVKSLEGSGSIFFISFLIYLIYSIVHIPDFHLGLVLPILLSGLMVTVAEILTPKGFDNLTIQVLAVLVYQGLVL